MHNSTTQDINKITNTLNSVVPEIITEINSRLSIISKQFKKASAP